MHVRVLVIINIEEFLKRCNYYRNVKRISHLVDRSYTFDLSTSQELSLLLTGRGARRVSLPHRTHACKANELVYAL